MQAQLDCGSSEMLAQASRKHLSEMPGQSWLQTDRTLSIGSDSLKLSGDCKTWPNELHLIDICALEDDHACLTGDLQVAAQKMQLRNIHPSCNIEEVADVRTSA